MKKQWVPPPGWPPPPSAGWAPAAGWQPDSAWPQPPADWEYWQSMPSRPVQNRTKVGAVICAVGAIIAIVGAFGSWITVSSRFVPDSVHSGGFQSGHDGPYVLALSLVVLGIAVPKIAGIRLPIWLDIVAVVVAVLLVVICIADTVDVHHRAMQVRILDPRLTGSVGTGLKLALVGSIATVVGTVAGFDFRHS